MRKSTSNAGSRNSPLPDDVKSRVPVRGARGNVSMSIDSTGICRASTLKE